MVRSTDGDEPRSACGSEPTARRADPSAILVVLPNWVGDMVLATPALRAMRERFASSKISVLVKSHLTGVLAGGTWMDEVIVWPKGGGQSRPKRRKGFLGLAGELRERQFEWAVLLANSFRSALLTRLAAIPRRIGYDRDGRGLLLTDRLLPQKVNGKFVPVPMIRYYNAVARYLGCRDCPSQPELFTTSDEERVADSVLRAAPGQPIVIINPAASFGAAKCWLPERFAEVGDQLAAEHKAAVFIVCGPKETAVAREVYNRMKQPAFVLDSPVLPLGPLKALIRRANLLVTNDTGPRHFANAFGTPVATIFGPTDPQWTATGAPRERSLMVKVNCGPCMKRTCPLDHRCMTRVSTGAVLDASRELLAGQPAVACGGPQRA